MSSLQPYSNTAEPLPGSTLAAIKFQQRAREEEEKIKSRRRKAAIIIIEQFFQEMNYHRSLEALQDESGVIIGKNTMPSDNIDLLNIIITFEEYYEYKFGKLPKMFRRLDKGELLCNNTHASAVDDAELTLTKKRASDVSAALLPSTHTARGSSIDALSSTGLQLFPLIVPTVATGSGNPGNPRTNKVIKGSTVHNRTNNNGLEVAGAQIRVGNTDDLLATSLSALSATRHDGGVGGGADDSYHDDFFTLQRGRPMKPMPRFATPELADIAASIQRDILIHNPNVYFDDIAEHDSAKQLLKEAVVMPSKYPEIFAGILQPWRGILLFGCSGTGKTMLAKAVATESKTTFFNISASTIVSKWRGDSEKLVRMLFDLALHYAPSTVFIDELDSIMSARSSDGSEHEGSRRMKTELLIQMDGLVKGRQQQLQQLGAGGGTSNAVFVLAATNVPWDLDMAVLRRMEKRVLVELPSIQARAKMFANNLRKVSEVSKLPMNAPLNAGLSLSVEELEQIAALTEGYSGADIDIICREATMRPIRHLIELLEKQGSDPKAACYTGQIPIRRPKVTVQDVLISIECTQRSTTKGALKKYIEWDIRHGSTLSKKTV